jgi:hypothetical protein
MRKTELMSSFRASGFVCILHAVIGDVSLLCSLSVLKINNLPVFNTCAGSTPTASTTLSISVFSGLQPSGKNFMHFACALGPDLTEFSIGLSLFQLRLPAHGRCGKGVARP